MPIQTRAEYEIGDVLVRYIASDERPECWGLVVLPLSRRENVVAPREWLDSPAVRQLPEPWNQTRAWEVDPLVHLHIAGDAYPTGFAHGRTLRNSATTRRLTVRDHHCERRPGEMVLRTVLATPEGVSCTHELSGNPESGVLSVQVTAINLSDRPIRLEYLSAFSLGGITPFAADDATGRLWLHRFRSAWSAEARHEERTVEALHLERSWTGHGVRTERFGQVGSMPVNGWFPFVGLEDRAAGVVWAAQLSTPGTWTLEAYRRDDRVTLSGGGPDQLAGEWSQSLAVGAAAVTPIALLTVTTGSIDDACERLTFSSRIRALPQPAREDQLPIVFNEWCTSWGNPTHESLVQLGEWLKDIGIQYLVIDDGWAERPGKGFQQNGDWRVNLKAFPGGLRETTDAIRQQGLIPGIWFEFESINPGSRAWNETGHQLHRNGVPLEVGNRRFWDFRDPWVHDFMAERVLARLRDDGFGYLKMDYNDSIGPGVDGPESPGENLRMHLRGVQRFLIRLRAEMPDLVIENCSSGGHRLEPSMLGLTSMSSFSDAHETLDLPIIAADLSRLVWSAQKQIWAVVRESDSLDRVTYSLAATFLGRMCLSGDAAVFGSTEATSLAPEAVERALHLRAGIDLYRRVAPIIRDGRFRIHREGGESRVRPLGRQRVTITSPDSTQLLVVWHRFQQVGAEPEYALDSTKRWRLEASWSAAKGEVNLQDNLVRWKPGNDWTAGVAWFRAD